MKVNIWALGFFLLCGLILLGYLNRDEENISFSNLKQATVGLFGGGEGTTATNDTVNTLKTENLILTSGITGSKKKVTANTTKACTNEVITYEVEVQPTTTYKKKERGPTVTYGNLGSTKKNTASKETAEAKLARQENELKGRIQASLINSSFKEREFTKKNPEYSKLVEEADVALENGDISAVNKAASKAEEMRGTSLKFRPTRKGETLPKHPLYGGGN